MGTRAENCCPAFLTVLQSADELELGGATDPGAVSAGVGVDAGIEDGLFGRSIDWLSVGKAFRSAIADARSSWNWPSKYNLTMYPPYFRPSCDRPTAFGRTYVTKRYLGAGSDQFLVTVFH